MRLKTNETKGCALKRQRYKRKLIIRYLIKEKTIILVSFSFKTKIIICIVNSLYFY